MATGNLLDQKLEPLRFTSHGAAMNFAYYITARVFQCTKFLVALRPGHDEAQMSGACKAGELWIMVLLRLSAAIDWDDCSRLNTYTVGLSGLLLACVLRSHNLAVGLWVQDWLSRQYQGGCLEEGSFPIFQILQVLRIINRERRSGRHVYAVCQAVDDGGGVGKFDSYNSQRLESVLVYGVCTSSCSLYSRHISLQEMHLIDKKEERDVVSMGRRPGDLSCSTWDSISEHQAELVLGR